MGEADRERVAEGDMGLRTAALQPRAASLRPPTPPGSLCFGAFVMGTVTLFHVPCLLTSQT